MGRGYPYWIVAKSVEVEYDIAGVPTGRREEFWAAYSNLTGSCGHRHPDEDSAAQQCLPVIEAQYRALRWPKRNKESQ